jgi:pseudouridine-5'-phosphate glycosidase
LSEQILPPAWQIHPEVRHALQAGQPLVALESTVITHGLPYPENLELGLQMEMDVRGAGATPATVAVLDGVVHLGLAGDELKRLAQEKDLVKISGRDLAPAIAQKRSGGTTVAGTLIAASAVGIHTFATGGIGGVHRQAEYDISADLIELARRPLVVVCAGAKAILDLPATLEMLETLGVPVVGYRVDEFPAFYTRSSGLPVSARVENAEEAAALARAHWALGLSSAVLLVQPPPEAEALPAQEVRGAIEQALDELRIHQIRGQEATPFLLRRVSELTGGASLRANLALLRNNARLAAQVARALSAA